MVAVISHGGPNVGGNTHLIGQIPNGAIDECEISASAATVGAAEITARLVRGFNKSR